MPYNRQQRSHLFHKTFMTHLRLILLTLLSLPGLLSLTAAENKKKRPRVALETTAGTIIVTLFDETPVHRDNFLKLVREGYYDGLLFHRVIKDFMIQTGDPDSRNAAPGAQLGEGGPDYTLPLELAWPFRYHYRGAVAAAREGDDVNPQRRSSGSQFYIVWGKRISADAWTGFSNSLYDMSGGALEYTPEMAATYRSTGGTPHLDGQYTVFGEVTAGLKFVKHIQAVATDRNDRPLEDVKIIRARVMED